MFYGKDRSISSQIVEWLSKADIMYNQISQIRGLSSFHDVTMGEVYLRIDMPRPRVHAEVFKILHITNRVCLHLVCELYSMINQDVVVVSAWTL